MLSTIRSQTSKKCLEDLKDAGLIKHNYTAWGVKSQGMMEGLTLFGTTKNGKPKKVYVKNYMENYLGESFGRCDYDELSDFAAFTILERCGVPAPKVTLKGTRKNIYLFSTDIANRNKTFQGKNYYYFDAEKLPYHFKNGTFSPSSGKVPIDKPILLDSISFVRAVLLASLLVFSDLNSSNIGYLISENHHQSKAKLVFIDFIVAMDLDLSLYQNPKELVRGVLKDMSFEDDNYLQDLFTDSAFVQAFKKIEDNFAPACLEIKNKIKDFSFESEDKKKEAYNLIDRWQDNFILVLKLINKIKNAEQSQEKDEVNGTSFLKSRK